MQTNYSDIRHRAEVETSWITIDKNFDCSRPKRLVDGIVVTTAGENANGHSYKASGLNIKTPLPLVWNHSYTMPIGKVYDLRVRGDQVFFKAELLNSGRVSWAEEVWDQLLQRGSHGCSMHAKSLNGPVCDGKFSNWEILEITFADSGADPGARILKIYERESVVWFDGRPSTRVIWEE